MIKVELVNKKRNRRIAKEEGETEEELIRKKTRDVRKKRRITKGKEINKKKKRKDEQKLVKIEKNKE